MSEQSASVAASMGAPEDLVMRSAQARAQATGTSVEEVLAAWGGGGALPTAPQPGATSAPEPEAPKPPPQAEAAPVPAAPEVPAPVDLPVAPVGQVTVIDRRAGAAPVLTGRQDRPLRLLVGLVALFVLGAVFAVGLPGADARDLASQQLPNTTPQLSELAVEGRQIYLREGCFYCHTQLVRSVVTDVGLGAVTEPGTAPALSPESYGFQRIGPDLTHVGSREPSNDGSWLRQYLVDPGSLREGSLQPSYAYLSDEEMDALVQFLLESE